MLTYGGVLKRGGGVSTCVGASTWDGRVNIRRRVEKGCRRVNMGGRVDMEEAC